MPTVYRHGLAARSRLLNDHFDVTPHERAGGVPYYGLSHHQGFDLSLGAKAAADMRERCERDCLLTAGDTQDASFGNTISVNVAGNPVEGLGYLARPVTLTLMVVFLVILIGAVYFEVP